MIRYETHIFIRYGTIYSYKSEYPLARVRQIRRHPEYMYRYGESINDIALLILDRKLRPSKDVGYAKLPTSNFNNKQKVFVYGWSGVDLGEQCSATLRKAEMIARPSWQTVTAQQAECRSVRNCKIMLLTNKFRGTEPGDSGGPVFLPDKTLVGHISGDLPDFSFVSPHWEEVKVVKVFYRFDFIKNKETHIVVKLDYKNQIDKPKKKTKSLWRKLCTIF